MDNIRRHKNGHLKQQEHWLPAASLGFKSLILQRLNKWSALYCVHHCVSVHFNCIFI